jgi:hypothetical protein
VDVGHAAGATPMAAQLARFHIGPDGAVEETEIIADPSPDSLDMRIVERQSANRFVRTYAYRPFGSVPLVAHGPRGRWGDRGERLLPDPVGVAGWDSADSRARPRRAAIGRRRRTVGGGRPRPDHRVARHDGRPAAVRGARSQGAPPGPVVRPARTPLGPAHATHADRGEPGGGLRFRRDAGGRGPLAPNRGPAVGPRHQQWRRGREPRQPGRAAGDRAPVEARRDKESEK